MKVVPTVLGSADLFLAVAKESFRCVGVLSVDSESGGSQRSGPANLRVLKLRSCVVRASSDRKRLSGLSTARFIWQGAQLSSAVDVIRSSSVLQPASSRAWLESSTSPS